MRCVSLNNLLPLAALALLAASCAASAPPLPPPAAAGGTEGIAASDLALDCPRVAHELAAVDAQMREANRRIEGERVRNQAIGYFAGLVMPPLALAAEHNRAERDLVRSLYARRDTLLRVAARKSCPLPL